MEEAFDRLTQIQKENVNKQMFSAAYACVVRSRGDEEALKTIIRIETEDCPHLTADLTRYCRLVKSVL